MKVRVIHKGVNINDERVPVGSVIDVEGDTVPAWLANKVEPVDGEGKTFVTNPAKPMTAAEKKAAKEQAAAERAALIQSAKLLGVEVNDKMTTEEINEAIAKVGQ